MVVNYSLKPIYRFVVAALIVITRNWNEPIKSHLLESYFSSKFSKPVQSWSESEVCCVGSCCPYAVKQEAVFSEPQLVQRLPPL